MRRVVRILSLILFAYAVVMLALELSGRGRMDKRSAPGSGAAVISEGRTR